MNNPQDGLVTKVEISVSCRDLKDMDVFSKSDPMGVLFQKLGNSVQEIGRTEMILNNLNPVFEKIFEIDYHFEERQLFIIELYDCDSTSHRLTDHDFLGRFEFSLGELVSRRKLEGKLVGCHRSGGKPQIVTLTCQEMPSCKESIIFTFSGHKLDKKDFFGKSDPVLELYRCNDPIPFVPNDVGYYNNFTMVYRSNPIMKTLDPNWKPFSVKINRLCFGDKGRLIKIVCNDWNSDGKYDFIGQCYTSVNHMIRCVGQSQAFELINAKLRSKKKNYKNSGTLTINQAKIQVDHSFIDYISGGTDLNFTVAIDFTASNGRQNDPRSLHFIPPNSNHQFNAMNQYERAILSVGSIIQDYDSTKMFPALGFGARIPPLNDISHCFPINFSMENPYCYGVDGLLNAYRSAILHVTLFGPTNFAPSIHHVQQFARNNRDGSKYFVLLIITDGIITDFDATIETIVDCSFLPMSIIIIGVGNEDFSAMDALDCDNGRLKYGHKVADRDIVQFVAIREYMSGRDGSINQAALSKAVLFELPNQLTDWMRKNGKAPLPSRKKPIPNPFGGDPSNIPRHSISSISSSHPPPYPITADSSNPPPYSQALPYPVTKNEPPPYPTNFNSPFQI